MFIQPAPGVSGRQKLMGSKGQPVLCGCGQSPQNPSLSTIHHNLAPMGQGPPGLPVAGGHHHWRYAIAGKPGKAMPSHEPGHDPEGANDVRAIPCGSCPVRTLAVCAALEPEELRRLAEISQLQSVEAGQTIFGEDDPADSLYNVTTGTAKMYKLLPDGRRQIIGFLFAGEIGRAHV